MQSNSKVSIQWNFLILISVTFITIKINALDEYRIVDTKYGKIRGFRNRTLLDQVDFYSFKGVYYAKNPVGNLRFKAPEPIEPWAPKVIDAFKNSPSCNRLFMFWDVDGEQGEDCLSMNIFVPADAGSDRKLPVLFYIHPGGYIMGSNNDQMFGPDFMMERNVILVTINYRLGAFGFLSFGTPEYSGNMGLKDQQLALKWVHENINDFYGDNKRITVIGNSAGGASTHFHVLSEESRRYFNNAILSSGTALTQWAMSSEPNHLPIAFDLAEYLGHPNITLDKLIDVFKTIPAEKLLSLGMSLTIWFPILDFQLAPIIEKKNALKPFLTQHPADIYKTSNLSTNILVIEALHEWDAVFSIKLEVGDEIVSDLNEEFDLILPFREYKFPVESEEYQKLAREIRKFYFGDAAIDEKQLRQCMDIVNDINFDYGAYKTIQLHTKESLGKTFLIRYSAKSKLNVFQQGLNQHLDYATHCDEMGQLFLPEKTKNILLDKDLHASIEIMRNYTKLITNFAKYGEPTYKDELVAGYHAIDGNDIEFLDITNDGLRVDKNPRKTAMEFWASLEMQAKDMFGTYKQQLT